MKRQFLEFINYDKKRTKIPLSKGNYWFRKDLGYSHCVVSCSNFSDVFHITEYGFCNIAYCEAHAKIRILNDLLTGQLERGLWCEVHNGKLIPHNYYLRFITLFRKMYPKHQKKFNTKFSAYKMMLKEEINK